jgi:hypothetical protein
MAARRFQHLDGALRVAAVVVVEEVAEVEPVVMVVAVIRAKQ